MQQANNAYSKNYNKRFKRSDHVFGGRYKAIFMTAIFASSPANLTMMNGKCAKCTAVFGG